MFLGSEKRFLTSMAPVQVLSHLTPRGPLILQNIGSKRRETFSGESLETLNRTMSNNNLLTKSRKLARNSADNPSEGKTIGRVGPLAPTPSAPSDNVQPQWLSITFGSAQVNGPPEPFYSATINPIEDTSMNPSKEKEKPMSLSPPRMSLLIDTNLPDPELNLIRSLHSHRRGARTTSCVGVVLQHIWEAYGNIPTEKTLLYACIMWESYWKDYGTPGWSSTGTWEFYNYKDKFIKELGTALKSENAWENVGECHFFALFVASQSLKSGVAGFKEELHTYQQGIVRIFLWCQKGKGTYRPLTKLYPFVLSFTRRIMCRGDFSMPEYLVKDAAEVVSEEAQRVSPEPLGQHFHEDDFEHYWTFWNATVCCLCKEFATIEECFQTFLASGEAYHQLSHPIDRIRFKVDEMIKDLTDVFRNVSFIFCPFPQIIKSLTS
jgi:hypothetical protein